MSKILQFLVKVIMLGIIDLFRKKCREEVNGDGKETSDESKEK